MLPEDSSFDRARLGNQPRSSHFVYKVPDTSGHLGANENPLGPRSSDLA